MKSKVFSILLAIVMVASVASAPLAMATGTDDGAAAETQPTAPDYNLSGSYGAVLDKDGIYSALNAIIPIINESGSADPSAPVIVLGDSFDKETFQQMLVLLMEQNGMTVPEGAVTVTEFSSAENAFAGVVLDISQTQTDLDVTANIALSSSLKMSAKVVFDIEGVSFSVFINNLEVVMNAGGTASINTYYDPNYMESGVAVWVADDMAADAAIAMDVKLDMSTDYPEVAEQLGSVKLDTGLNIFASIDTVKVGDSMQFIGTFMNNIGSFVNDVSGIMGGAESTSAYNDIPAFASGPLPMDLEAVPAEQFGIVGNLLDLSSDDLSYLIAAYMLASGSTTPSEPGTDVGMSYDFPTILQKAKDYFLTQATEEEKAILDAIKSGVTALLGNDGLALSSADANTIRDRAKSAMDSATDSFNSQEHKVTVLGYASPGYYEVKGEVSIKTGGAIPNSGVVSDVIQNPPAGKKFVGWKVATDTSEVPEGIIVVDEMSLDIDRIYSDLVIFPEYADVVDSMDQIIPNSNRTYVVQVPSGDLTESDFVKFATSHVVLDLTDVETAGLVNGVSWSFDIFDSTDYGSVVSMSTKVSVSAPTETVSQALAGKSMDGAIMLNFEHSGAVPDGTYVIVNVGDRYDVGTAFEVYHIDDTNAVSMTSSAVTVDASGNVKIPIEHCSSYVLVQDSVIDDVPVGNGSGPGDGGNWLLYGGIAIGVIVLLGVVIFLIKRR